MIEIVGIAGSGKTTITNQLLSLEIVKSCYSTKAIRGINICYLCINYLSSLLKIRVNKLYLHNLRSLLWLEKNLIVARKNLGIVVDQGFIFHLAFILSIGSNYKPSVKLQSYSYALLKDISEILDTIIFLEVNIETALIRARERVKFHSLKNRTDKSAFLFLTEFNKVYINLLNKAEKQGVRIIYINNDMGPDKALDKIKNAIQNRF